jgi:PAS domain-containing protein
MLDSEGKVSEIIGTTRKIDDRKQLELKLKESDEKFSAITENSQDVI